jgi:hypothetical protein
MRDYLKQTIVAVLPDMKEWTGSLEDIGNIPQTILDRTYHIAIGAGSAGGLSDHHVEDSFSVVVTLFKRGYSEPVVARDSVLQTANCIRLAVVSPTNIEAYKAANEGNIEAITPSSITPSEIATSNDNIIKVEINFTVRLFWTV